MRLVPVFAALMLAVLDLAGKRCGVDHLADIRSCGESSVVARQNEYPNGIVLIEFLHGEAQIFAKRIGQGV